MNRVYKGEFKTNLAATIDEGQREFQMRNTDNNQTAGTFKFNQIVVIQRPSFVEYLRSGWGISLAVAIDFTASNGDPRDHRSLHALSGNNQYQ